MAERDDVTEPLSQEEPDPAATARFFWHTLVSNGDENAPQRLSIAFDCPSADAAEQLATYLNARRGLEARIANETVHDDLREHWSVAAELPARRMSLEWLQQTLEFFETAAVLHDSVVEAIGLT
jgi:hypothetical protein